MPVEIAQKIEQKIALLEKGRKQLEGAGNDKALNTALYDKDLAITLIGLKNGKSFMLDEEMIKDVPASTAEKIAKGIVWESRLRMEQAEATYKAVVTKLDTIQTEINALQSINRHLSET